MIKKRQIQQRRRSRRSPLKAAGRCCWTRTRQGGQGRQDRPGPDQGKAGMIWYRPGTDLVVIWYWSGTHLWGPTDHQSGPKYRYCIQHDCVGTFSALGIARTANLVTNQIHFFMKTFAGVQISNEKANRCSSFTIQPKQLTSESQ